MKTWQIIPALLAAVVVTTLPLQATIAGENAGSCVESAVAFPELEWGAWTQLPEWEASTDIRDEASGSNPLMLASDHCDDNDVSICELERANCRLRCSAGDNECKSECKHDFGLCMFRAGCGKNW